MEPSLFGIFQIHNNNGGGIKITSEFAFTQTK